MKRTLDAVAFYFADTERHTAMRTQVAHDRQLTFAIAPCDDLLAHAREADRPAFFDLIGFQNDVPLIGDHDVPC